MRTLIVRTLFQFIHLNPTGDEYMVRIPAWDHNLAVRIKGFQITPEVLSVACDGMRCYGTANLRAETYHDLQIHINELRQV